jgi:hypothetical protein
LPINIICLSLWEAVHFPSSSLQHINLSHLYHILLDFHPNHSYLFTNHELTTMEVLEPPKATHPPQLQRMFDGVVEQQGSMAVNSGREPWLKPIVSEEQVYAAPTEKTTAPGTATAKSLEIVRACNTCSNAIIMTLSPIPEITPENTQLLVQIPSFSFKCTTCRFGKTPSGGSPRVIAEAILNEERRVARYYDHLQWTCVS